jgi:chemotaxis protein histidine kinase CheA
MKKTGNSLLEGMERLGLMAARIRQNEGVISRLEIDIILQELRDLYVDAIQCEVDNGKVKTEEPDAIAAEAKRQAIAAQKAAEEKRLAEEAAAKKAAEEKRLAEEAAVRKAAEEKRLAEEAAARKAAEEKRLAEEAAARKAAEEKRLAEEAAAKRAAEEKRLAEEAAARKAAEEKRLAEEAAAKKAAEEKRLAEEAAARKAAEEKRLAEEAAARKAAEEELKPIFAPEPAGQEPASVVEPMMEKIEGNRNDELFAEKPEPAQKPLRKKQQESSLFDYFKNESLDGTPRRTLADTLNQGGRNIEEQLESRVNAKKVDDLRTIININDKFSFMSELFHNNMKAYNDFILRLNSYTSREEALAYVAEVSAQNMWNESSLVVKNFYKVFDRKF